MIGDSTRIVIGMSCAQLHTESTLQVWLLYAALFSGRSLAVCQGLRDPDDGLTEREPACGRVSSMSDQQKTPGNWTEPDAGPTGSEAEAGGKSAPDRSTAQLAQRPPEGEPVPDQVLQDQAGPSTAEAGVPMPPSSAPGSTPTAGAAAPVWRDQYLKERKKSRLFMATTAVAVVLLIGSLLYAVGQSDSTQVADPVGGGAGLEEGHRPGSAPGEGGGLGQGSLSMQQFFDADGSLNEELVASFRERAEQMGATGQFSNRLVGAISNSVATGEITQEQADELLEGLDLSSSGDGA